MLRRTLSRFCANTSLIRYEVSPDRICTLTFTRTSIVDGTGPALEAAVRRAENDNDVRVIVLTGEKGKIFCGGYDLDLYAVQPNERSVQTPPADLVVDYKFMSNNTRCWMSLQQQTVKPVLASVRGAAVGGGSDIALSADMVVCAENTKIGYPPSTLWGCPTTMWWPAKLGAEKAKYLLFTGGVLTGKEAEEWGLVLKAVPEDKLDEEVGKIARRIASVPENHLAMSKLAINHHTQQNMPQTQMLANFFDGFSRNSPEGVAFKRKCEERGEWRSAIKERDAPPPPLK